MIESIVKTFNTDTCRLLIDNCSARHLHIEIRKMTIKKNIIYSKFIYNVPISPFAMENFNLNFHKYISNIPFRKCNLLLEQSLQINNRLILRRRDLFITSLDKSVSVFAILTNFVPRIYEKINFFTVNILRINYEYDYVTVSDFNMVNCLVGKMLIY